MDAPPPPYSRILMNGETKLEDDGCWEKELRRMERERKAILRALEAADPSHELIRRVQRARRREKQLAQLKPSSPRRDRLTSELSSLRGDISSSLRSFSCDDMHPFEKQWTDPVVGYPHWAKEGPLRNVYLGARAEVMVGRMDDLTRRIDTTRATHWLPLQNWPPSPPSPAQPAAADSIAQAFWNGLALLSGQGAPKMMGGGKQPRAAGERAGAAGGEDTSVRKARWETGESL